MLATHTMGFRQEFTGGFTFDEAAHKQSSDALFNQLAANVYERTEAVRIGDLYSSTCNTSPATSSMYKLALEALVGARDIVVTSKEGARRMKARYMTDSDLIERNPQSSLFTGPGI